MCDALGLLRITCMGRGHLLEYEQLANGYTNEEKNSPPPLVIINMLFNSLAGIHK